MKVYVTFGLGCVAAALASVPLMTAARAVGGGLPVHNITLGTDYATIQAAINAAGAGHVIVVDPGTYVERINLLGKAITLRSTAPTDPAVVAATIIDGDAGGSVITCNNLEGANTEIRGFTITNGHAADGGGMYNEGAIHVSVYNCVFSGNTALGIGGGMYNVSDATGGPNPLLTDCVFTGNSATDGGGVGNFRGAPWLSGCTFTGNTATANGGGMSSHGRIPGTPDFKRNPLVINCTFTGNSAALEGGGMHNVPGTQSDSWATVFRCTFTGNSANRGGGMFSDVEANVNTCMFAGNSSDTEGGGMRIIGGTTTMTNCTLTGNSAGSSGGGMGASNSSPTVTDCILWGNTAPDGPQILDGPGGTTAATFSCIEGGWAGVGNIDDDPLFSAGPDGCFYLSQTAAGLPFDSPCLDAGSDTAASLRLDDVATRRDEVVDAGMVDMGYHYPVTGQPFSHGDFDRDGDLDLDDFGEWTTHVTGPCAAEPCWPTAYAAPCGNIADFDDDGDVDFHDFGEFQAAFTGP